ncbi:hypothetical protein FLA_0287 [Filimonas lacunae]|nr:hypothetical protein FLA_0287 [Filimonas lacunae]
MNSISTTANMPVTILFIKSSSCMAHFQPAGASAIGGLLLGGIQ